MLDVHAAREGMHVRVRRSLRLVQAAPAGEYEVGVAQQLGFAFSYFPRRARKAGELVHAVVHHGDWSEMTGVIEAHRRIEPKGEGLDLVSEKDVVEQCTN